MIDINFKSLKCNRCNCNENYAVLKGSRYGIYCKGCGAYIKWADKSQTTIIKAREEWLKNNRG